MKIQLEQVDLLKPWPTLELRPGYRQMRVLLRAAHVPIDELSLRPMRPRITPQRLRRIIARRCTWSLVRVLCAQALHRGPEALARFPVAPEKEPPELMSKPLW